MKRNLALSGLFVALAGCGGGGGGGTLTSTDAMLNITRSPGYNGSALRLSGAPTGSVTNGTSQVVVTQGARRLVISLPTATPQNGAQFTVGQNGTVARYSEGVTGSPDNVWTGTGGLIKVQSVRNTLFLTLIGVSFAADAEGGSQAAGTLSMSGTIAKVHL